jgi:hypothetical protein
MRKLTAFLSFLVACGGAKTGEVALTVTGVSMSDIEAIRGELGRLKGVAGTRAGQFKDGQVVIAVRFEGKGGDLATLLTQTAGGLKNVQGFDDRSVQVAYGAAPAPKPTVPEPAPAPAPAPAPPPTPAPSPPPAQQKKDPLAYRAHPAKKGFLATFEGWKVAESPEEEGAFLATLAPEGRTDFAIVAYYAAANHPEIGDVFQTGPAIVQQYFPALKPAGQLVKFSMAGDPAALQEFGGESQGKPLRARAFFLKRSDVAVIVLGSGAEPAFNEYVKGIAIVAASVTLAPASVPEGMIGTWGNEADERTMTICANGTFLARAGTQVDFGRAVVDEAGGAVAFRGDGGKEWKPKFRLQGGRLELDGAVWTRR